MAYTSISGTMPSSTQLDGFDISTARFPPKEWLPENVRPQQLDALGSMPGDLIGEYDVVHIGRIVLFIRNEDPVPLLKKFISLLSKLPAFEKFLLHCA